MRCEVKTFIATGKGPFPVDMLRYDQCWPTYTQDATEIFGLQKRGVMLTTINKFAPTHGRWESFGWVVEEREV
jgi:hypothetical protein